MKTVEEDILKERQKKNEIKKRKEKAPRKNKIHNVSSMRSRRSGHLIDAAKESQPADANKIYPRQQNGVNTHLRQSLHKLNNSKWYTGQKMKHLSNFFWINFFS